MSIINKGLSFYVVEMDEESFNLYNSMTDKNILFAQDRKTVKNFLLLNDPSHPFIFDDITKESSLTFEPLFETEYEYNINNDIKFEYSMYDPYYPDPKEESQLSFVFVKDNKKERENKKNKGLHCAVCKSEVYSEILKLDKRFCSVIKFNFGDVYK